MNGPLAWLRRHDRWIPICLVAGVFAPMLAANGALVAVAVRSFNGLATGSPYASGLAFNHTLEAARAQARLGWTSSLGFEQDGALAGRLSLGLTDAAGAAVHAAAVVGRLVRPAATGNDLVVTLAETLAGRYEARLELPLPGLWEIRIEAARGSDTYALRQRLVVR